MGSKVQYEMTQLVPYEVMFVEKISIKDFEEGKLPEKVWGPFVVIAADKEVAVSKAVSQATGLNIDKVDTYCRPFAE